MRIVSFARLACVTGLLFTAVACAAPTVDPGLVGTWEVNVPNADGVARWVWDIHADGTYAFHAEGPGNVPAHSGTFAARNGKYSLRATTMTWVDDGTYQLVHDDTLNAAGKLGRGTWTRVRPAPVAVDSSAPARADSSAGGDGAVRTGGPGIYTAASIQDYLAHHGFDDRAFTAPMKASRSETVDPDPQDVSDGVVGIVRAEVAGVADPSTVSLVVYRDRAAAEAAWNVYAIYDSKSFHMKPGEFVSSHAYTYHERGEARCLSRLNLKESSTATITCYLLVQYPTREPVIIESETTEHVAPKVQEASHAAIERGDDLLFAGIKEWAIAYPAIDGR
ncbi:MAG: hypothetical protein ACREK8_08820 [Gemmatimonadales bacterium]